MGVRELHFFHTRRVEKSFWQSTSLRDKAVREELALGLEQAKDTVFPDVLFHKRFKPFVEDVLPELLKGRVGIVADPSGEHLDTRHWTLDTGSMTNNRRRAGVIGPSSSVKCQVSSVLIIGPEGGFIPFEIEKFREAGCRIVSLGERILRVETAVVALLAKLF
jgi:RsmE family RNA methyltransferase